MKLSQFTAVAEDSERVATITICQKNGDPYTDSQGAECTISFTGDESKAYRAIRHRIQRRNLNRQKTKATPEDVLRNRIDLAGACVTAWTGFENDDGSPAACTLENVRTVLAVEHVLIQLEEGIAAHADFFVKSSPA